MKLKIDILIQFGNSFNDDDSLIKNSLVNGLELPEFWLNEITVFKR
jgi:hypothetical protein